MTQFLSLEIVTPEKVILETETEYVTVPGFMGELGILPDHISLLTNLKSGVLKYKSNQNEKKVAIHYGYAEVCSNKVTVLTDIAELSEDIDLNRAKQAQQKKEEILKHAITDKNDIKTDIIALQKEIHKAVTRQDTVH